MGIKRNGAGRAVPAKAGRRRRAQAIAVLLLGAALVGFGYLWARSSTMFAVEQAVVPVTKHLSEAQLRSALAPASGQNLFSLSTEHLEKRLKALAYVSEAEVYRRFPRSLEVSLVEREPVARVQLDGGRIWLLSEDGRVLEPDRGQAGDRVVIVPPRALKLKAGEFLPKELRPALELSLELEGADASVRPLEAQTLTVSQGGQGTLLLGSGLELRLGELTQLEEKLMVANRLIEEYSREGKELLYVDVYLPERPVAKAKAP